MAKTRRKSAKCRQCNHKSGCRLWAVEINKTDPATYEKPWETCGNFKEIDDHMTEADHMTWGRL
jgi:hypothetical protein